jgi:hypothetical protein
MHPCLDPARRLILVPFNRRESVSIAVAAGAKPQQSVEMDWREKSRGDDRRSRTDRHCKRRELRGRAEATGQSR